ncbi:MAG TPA: hypothetical protein VI455_01380 [Terriglobia bacterium]
MEGFNYLATLAVFADPSEDWDGLAVAAEGQLRAFPGVAGGAGTAARRGCVVRLLALSAADLSACTQALWAVARKKILRLAAFDLRKY